MKMFKKAERVKAAVKKLKVKIAKFPLGIWELKSLKAQLDTPKFEKWHAICASVGVVGGVLALEAR